MTTVAPNVDTNDSNNNNNNAAADNNYTTRNTNEPTMYDSTFDDDDDDDLPDDEQRNADPSSDPTNEIVQSSNTQLLSAINQELRLLVMTRSFESSFEQEEDDDQEQDDKTTTEDKDLATKGVSSAFTDNKSDNKDDYQKKRTLTLTSLQLQSLRQLQRRVRTALRQQQQAAQRGMRRVLTGDSNRRVRDAARSSLQQTQHVVKKRVRQVVTGDSERPLREWVKQSAVVKAIDKFSFVTGVFSLMATEFVFLQFPDRYGQYYVWVLSYMMALRLYIYRRQHLVYFLLDFCYFCNLSCVVAVISMSSKMDYDTNNKNYRLFLQRLLRLNFCTSNGPLLAAILAWRNSLVFHSLDKVTSIAIHILPSLLTYLQRWERNNNKTSVSICAGETCTWHEFGQTLVDTIFFYLAWQLLYILKTEFMDRHFFRANPDMQTSLRWLTRDTKNIMHRLAKKSCRALGILKPNEDFHPEALKTKLVFWIGQFLFTLVTLLPTPVLFFCQPIHMAYILSVLGMAVYNGSNYYFEVFAARYIQQLEQQQQRQQQQQKQKQETVVNVDEIQKDE